MSCAAADGTLAACVPTAADAIAAEGDTVGLITGGDRRTAYCAASAVGLSLSIAVRNEAGMLPLKVDGIVTETDGEPVIVTSGLSDHVSHWAGC